MKDDQKIGIIKELLPKLMNLSREMMMDQDYYCDARFQRIRFLIAQIDLAFLPDISLERFHEIVAEVKHHGKKTTKNA